MLTKVQLCCASSKTQSEKFSDQQVASQLCCGGLATWLILPVVICLSQRLSHAGLSISRNKVKPRMAHYISYGSLDLRYPTWITLEILELIHANVASTFVGEAFLLD